MEDTKYAEVGRQLEKRHPFKKASPISKVFFCWFFPIVLKGFRHDLTEKDLLPSLKAHESSYLGDKIEQIWAEETRNYKENASLWRVLWKMFRKEIIVGGIVLFFNEILVRLSQPLALSKLLSYYQPGSDMPKNIAYFYAGIVILTACLDSVTKHYTLYQLMHLGMKMRVAICSLMYRKALKLNSSSIAQTTVGQLVNLLSNDVGKLAAEIQYMHYLYLTPVLTVTATVLLYIYVGFTGLIGIAFMVLFIPLHFYVGKKTSTYRLKTALCSDVRIGLMNEIISGIKIIKMCTWEKPFSKLVDSCRRKELVQIRKNLIVRAVFTTLNLTQTRTSIFLCVLTHVLLGNSPTSQFVFVTSSFYNVLRSTVTTFFPKAVTGLAEMQISVSRIQEFLFKEETKSVDYITDKSIDKETMVQLTGVSVKWLNSSLEHSLCDIDFSANTNQLVAVIGHVGCGKSTLFSIILNELTPFSGKIYVNGAISYASQEPWVFASSIRQNILFGLKYERKKYDEIVTVCSLDHDFSMLPFGDLTIAGERGVTLSGGQRARVNLARALYRTADIYLLDDPLSAVDTRVGKQLFENIRRYLKNKCVILVTHQLQYLQNVDKIYVLVNGTIVATGTYDELQISTNYLNVALANKDITHDNTLENNENDPRPEIKLKASNGTKEWKESGKVSWLVYKFYLLCGGHWIISASLLLVFIITQTFASFVDWFGAYWVNMEQKRLKTLEIIPYTSNATTDQHIIFGFDYNETNCAIFYTVVMILTLLIAFSRSVCFFRFCTNAARKLHDKTFKAIVNTNLRFFTLNHKGRIINRFSKDIGNIDNRIPIVISETMQVGLIAIATCAIIVVASNWIIVPTILLFLIFYGSRMVFLASSREINRWEGITRSPMFAHLTESIQGLATVRAFKAEDILKQEFDNFQNNYSSAYFTHITASRAFAFWLDMQCIIYAAIVTLSFLFTEQEIYGGSVGLAITQSLGLTGLIQYGVRQWTDLENAMTSVERVKEYAILPSEHKKIHHKAISDAWPESGDILFRDVSLKYDLEEPYVLQNVSFNIKDGEKVGVVGRTGAGKSSLISAFFRLALVDGSIIISGVDTSEIPLETLRSRLSIIPQEPVLFCGPLRKNLDPFDEYEDEVLWRALEQVELKKMVSDLPKGLLNPVQEGGNNLSVGQRQLVCLARAIIKNNKILISDEATANVDLHTDSLIQKTIRENFINCTVITIAHRLHTIIDSDKILVMDSGKVVEFGHPYVLLHSDKSAFKSLVEQMGEATVNDLIDLAKKKYNECDIPE